MTHAPVSDEQPGGVLDAIVVGAGFAGMYMVHRLREQGMSVHGFEAGDSVGGTWYWNRYPGARCDSESMYYSYSFLPELEQEWPLEERYPGQPEILRYLEHVADHLDLRKDFTFNARVTSAEYDEAANRWTVRSWPLGRSKSSARAGASFASSESRRLIVPQAAPEISSWFQGSLGMTKVMACPLST